MPENSVTQHTAHTEISQFLHSRFSEVIEEIGARISLERDQAVAAAGHKSRRAATDEMNQIMRRLRDYRSTDEVAAWLVDSTSSFCGCAALFEVTSTMLRGVRSRGFAVTPENLARLEIPLDSAPAFGHCVQERDTVVAIGAGSEISAAAFAALGHGPDERVYLYPIVIEEKTAAILYATAGGEPERQFVDGAALELLTQAAASAAHILSSTATSGARTNATELVKIEGIEMPGIRPTRANSAILQKAREARARWQARAAVAGLQLKKKEAVERGRRQRDIYSSLRTEIDMARRAYAQDFLAVSPAIADYLHRELLKLAHDDASVLGPDYPGSLV